GGIVVRRRSNGRELAEIFDEDEPAAPKPDLVARAQRLLVLNGVAVDARAIQAAEVAHRPRAIGLKDFGMLAAAQVVVEDDFIGFGTAEDVALTGLEGKDVSQAVGATDHQKCFASGRHALHLDAVRISEQEYCTTEVPCAASV